MGKIILNGINYGGSVVTPNPSGAATDTLTKVGIDGDVYDLPSGGSTNSYGYNAPSDNEGVNGDIYCKISDISGEEECVDSTITFPTTKWTAVPLLRDSAAYTTFVMSGSHTFNGNTYNYTHTYDTSTIGTSEDTATTLYGRSNSTFGKMYKSGSSLYVYINSATFRISSLVGTYTDAHAVNDIYQKVEGSWAKLALGRYEQTTLWSGSQEINAWATPYTVPNFNLSVLNSYDTFIFNCEIIRDNNLYQTTVTSDFIKENANAYIYMPQEVEHSGNIAIYYDSTNDEVRLYGETNYGFRLKKIMGINYNSVNSSSSSEVNYSTEEQRIGTWIDGKPLYQKTLSITGTYAGNRNIDVSSYIDSNMNIIYVDGIGKYTSSNGDNYYAINSSIFVYPQEDFNTLKLNWGSSTLPMELAITIRYTKTTD